MSDTYTERVRDFYASAVAWDMGSHEGRPDLAANRDRMYRQFDAWLAAHDAQVKAEALREAAECVNCADDFHLLTDRADAIEAGDDL